MKEKINKEILALLPFEQDEIEKIEKCYEIENLSSEIYRESELIINKTWDKVRKLEREGKEFSFETITYLSEIDKVISMRRDEQDKKRK